MTLRPGDWTAENPEVADVAYWGSLEPPKYATDPVVIERIRENQARLKPPGKVGSQDAVREAAQGAAVTPLVGPSFERLRELMPLASEQGILRLAEAERYLVVDPELDAHDLVESLSRRAIYLIDANRREVFEGRWLAPGGEFVDLVISSSPELVSARAAYVEADLLRRAELWEALVGDQDGVYAPMVDGWPAGLYRTSEGRFERFTPSGWVEDAALVHEAGRPEVEPISPALADELERAIARC